jgi:hypothetical protein
LLPDHYHLSELSVLPAVDDNVTAGVEHQEQMGEVGQQVAPWGGKNYKHTVIVLTKGSCPFKNVIWSV